MINTVNNVYLLEREYYAAAERIDPFQNAVPCWHWKRRTQQELDLGLYGFTNRYY